MSYYETYDNLLEDIAEPEVEALGSYEEFDDWSDKYIREDWRLRDSIRDYIGALSYCPILSHSIKEEAQRLFFCHHSENQNGSKRERRIAKNEQRS